MFYNIFVSFGTSVLLYYNKMASISPEMTEAAELDGERFSGIFPHRSPAGFLDVIGISDNGHRRAVHE